MRVALIASPFISVPPTAYGGTELFIASLAEALIRLGVEVDVYANGESRVKANLKSLYPTQEWPLSSEVSGLTKEIDHMGESAAPIALGVGFSQGVPATTAIIDANLLQYGDRSWLLDNNVVNGCLRCDRHDALS